LIIDLAKPSIEDARVDASAEARTAELSVIVPAYREGQRIHANLIRLLGELDKLSVQYEVIVVSDGNIDATAAQARLVQSPAVKVFEYPMNAGKGFALSLGVSQSSGSLVTFIDADMELDPANIKGFIDLMRDFECDAVIGSKRHPASRVLYPAFRRFQSVVYQLFVRLLFNLDVRDTQTGLKLFRRQVLQEAVPLLAIKRFAFDLELLVVARFLGYRKICEAPITLNYQFESTVNLASAWNVLWDTAAIFYRLRILRYYQRRQTELAVIALEGGSATDRSTRA
jgi:glycosyltransferase involved in cell wall biosynthesis